MRYLSLSFLFACALFFTGCQKEPDAELPVTTAPGETPDGSRLSRMVFQFSATDSAYSDFQYDASGRWIGQMSSGDDLVLTDVQKLTIERDANGTITRYISYYDLTPGDVDSTITMVYNNAATKRYTYKVTLDAFNGVIDRDSVVYEYDNNGRIGAERYFSKESNMPAYVEIGKSELTYEASGNLKTIRTLFVTGLPGTSMRPVMEIGFTYDDKINPLTLGNEALVLDQLFYCSKNNITDMKIEDLVTATDNERLQFAFNYHASNKPKSAKLIVSGGSLNMFYRYQ